MDRVDRSKFTVVFDNVAGVPAGHRVRMHHRRPDPKDNWMVVDQWARQGDVHFETAQDGDQPSTGTPGTFAQFVAEMSQEVDPEFNVNCIMPVAMEAN